MKTIKFGIVIFSIGIVFCIILLHNQKASLTSKETACHHETATAEQLVSYFLYNSVDTYLTSYYQNNYDCPVTISAPDIRLDAVKSGENGIIAVVYVHPIFSAVPYGYDEICYEISSQGDITHKYHRHIPAEK